MKKYLAMLLFLCFAFPLYAAEVINSGATNPVAPYGDYINFGSKIGSSGYGFRTNSGTVEVKNQTGTWAALYAGGSVTSVSVTTANGVSGSVANPTTTPAITLSLGAITPSSVNSVVLSGTATPNLSVTGTASVSGTNTGDQTNITGNAATVTTNANLTGHVTSTGNAAVLGSFTSANLAGALSDETGSGAAVFGTAPTLTGTVNFTDSIVNITNNTIADVFNVSRDTTSGALKINLQNNNNIASDASAYAMYDAITNGGSRLQMGSYGTNYSNSDFAGKSKVVGYKNGLILGSYENGGDIDFWVGGADASYRKMKLFSNGYLGLGYGAIGTAGLFEVRDGGIALTDADVNQPFSSFHSTLFGEISSHSDTAGGVRISGVSDTDATALALIGQVGTSTPTTAAVSIVGYKNNAGSATALAFNEKLYSLSNNGLVRHTIFGNGGMSIGTSTNNFGGYGVNQPVLTMSGLTGDNYAVKEFINPSPGINSVVGADNYQSASTQIANIQVSCNEATNKGKIRYYLASDGGTMYDTITMSPTIVYFAGNNIFMGVGTTTPSTKLDVVGTVTASMGYKFSDGSSIISGKQPFIQLSDSTNQEPGVTTPVIVTFDTQDSVESMSQSGGTITVHRAGVYSILACGQAGKTQGATNIILNLWAKKNTSWIPNSSVSNAVKIAEDRKVLPLNIVTRLAAGDTINIYQSIDTTGDGAGLKVYNPSGEPRIPSIIFTMYRIGD